MENARFQALVEALSNRDVNTSVAAARSLQQEASAADVTNLLRLLEDDDFFVREAAAWPLAELTGPTVLSELLLAYQRGFEQGHDNDGFTAALLEIPALFPRDAQVVLQELALTAQEPVRSHALWLLSFVPKGEDNDA